MEEKFKLSEELKSIFKESAELVKKEEYKEVSGEIVAYHILKRYFKENKGTDPILNEYFESKLTKEDKEKLLEAAELLMRDMVDNYKNPLPDSLKQKDHPTAVSIITDNLLSRAKMEQMMFMSSGSINEDEVVIETSIFFLSMLFEFDELVELFNAFDVNKEGLTSLIVSKGKNKIEDENDDLENPALKLKEKIINNPGSVSSEEDDKANKERIENEDKEFEMAGKMGSGEDMIQDDPNSEHPFLDKYCINMNKEVDNYDPLIGREKELSQIIEVLNCRKKRNVIVVADEGVGKDCLIEGFVQNLVKGNVPKKLKDKIVYSFDLNKITSGTQFRGNLESRLDGVLSEASKDKNVILYIPEIHSLDGANSNNSSGAGGIEDVLKPYLTGKISVIGSTTTKELRVVEKDPAFKRRFQIVRLDEPNIEQTIEILKGLRNNYSKFHRVKFSDEIIKLCVSLSDRYITDKHQPDKSVDCIDMIGSLVNLRETDKGDDSELTRLEKELAEVINDKIKLVKDQDFEAAAKIRDKEKELRKKIESIRKVKEKEEENSKNWPEATKEDVLSVISKISKVPVENLGKSEMERVLKLEESLKRVIIGQDEGIDKIIRTLQRNALNLRDPKKPIASILLIASSATGKTQSARQIAKEFFGSEKNMVRLDMNEYKDEGSITKLLGSSPQYVGYDSFRPELDKVRTNPYTVILIDEIEKASKSVLDAILCILDEGHVKLSNGVDIDFRNTIILATSNLGIRQVIEKGDGLGFNKLSGKEKDKDTEATIMKSVRKFFRPEFLNRLSDIVFYRNLDDDDYKKIIEIELKKLSERLKEKGMKIKVTNDLKSKIIKEVDRNYNVRSLQRNIVKYVENEICDSILKNKIVDLDKISTIIVDYRDDKVVVSFINKEDKKTKKKIAIPTSDDKKEVVE